MAQEDNGTLRSVAWSEVLPWLSLFRCFRLAIRFRVLLLSAVAILLTLSGWAVFGVVFWEAGRISLSDDLSVSVDAPCLLILRGVGADLMLTASNPANEPLDLVVEVSARLSGEGCTWNAESRCTRVAFPLPGGIYGGQSVRRRLHRP